MVVVVQIPIAARFCEKRAEFFVLTGKTAACVDAHNGQVKKEFSYIMPHEISACAIDPEVNKVSRQCIAVRDAKLWIVSEFSDTKT